MTMVAGEDEYVVRRTDVGKWERRPVSQGAWATSVGRKMEAKQFSDAENVALLEQEKVWMIEISKGDPSFVIPVADLAVRMRLLPAGSEVRRLTLETLMNRVRKASGQDAVDRALKAEKQIEMAEAIEEWMKDNEGFEPISIFEAPIETAYQRYIRQG
jgi:hypothetical protein